jgi:hypothetical protein
MEQVLQLVEEAVVEKWAGLSPRGPAEIACARLVAIQRNTFRDSLVIRGNVQNVKPE